jgi:hypothetical protein
MFVLIYHSYYAHKVQSNNKEFKLLTSYGNLIKLKHTRCFDTKLLQSQQASNPICQIQLLAIQSIHTQKWYLTLYGGEVLRVNEWSIKYHS